MKLRIPIFFHSSHFTLLPASAWLPRLGLGRPELRAWALYDWANSAFVTTVIAAVFPIYFSSVAAADLPPVVATARFAMATTIALAIIAVLAPFLGALADARPIKKKLLAAFLGLGVVATAGMSLIQRGQWEFAALLFMLGNIGVAGSFIFYDALLPHIASDEEMDRVSTAGYALGYLGGGLLLAVNLAVIQYPTFFGLTDAAAASRLSFFTVAVWWLVFSLPLFRSVREPSLPTGTRRDEPPLRASVMRLGKTLRRLRGYKQAFLFLVAFLLYNEGIGTIIRMAAVYGTEIGIPQSALITAILLVQFVGIPCSFVFGALAGRMGAKRAIFLSLVVYTLVSVIGYFMTTALHFYLLAILVGIVQGGSQALSRSLFAGMIPRAQSSEFFAFFAVGEKFAGILGPATFAVMILATGSSRNALLAVVVFFIVGGTLLAFVNVAEGQRAARAGEGPPRRGQPHRAPVPT
ncbi:MAG: MFS transporter [Candidatus Binatia bacterium]